jgi:hypothetical protein
MEDLLQLLPSDAVQKMRQEWQDKSGNLTNAPQSSEEVWDRLRSLAKTAREGNKTTSVSLKPVHRMTSIG